MEMDFTVFVNRKSVSAYLEISSEHNKLISEAPGAWMQNQNGQGSAKKRKKKSRWTADEEEKAIIPTVIPAGLSQEQEDQYLGM